MKSRWIRITLFPLLFLCVTAQDANWGIKVPCYIVDGMTICPGCNARGGLICPRVMPDETRRGSSSTTEAPVDDKSGQGKESTVVDGLTDVTETTVDAETKPPDPTTIEMDNSIRPQPTDNPLLMHLFLYQILRNSDMRRPYFKVPRRLKREADAEDGTCSWNGDCPCPQICCGNGEGLAKTCKMGIRLPPPWGK